jgi:hypothetical protein
MLIGRTDRVPGICYVATDVVELAWIPLWPRASWIIEEGSETHGRYYRGRLTALFDDTIEGTTDIEPGTEVHQQQWRGQRLPFQPRSFFRGLAQRLGVILGIGLVLVGLESEDLAPGLGLVINAVLFCGLTIASYVAQLLGRIRAGDTMRAGSAAAFFAIFGGFFLHPPWWVVPIGAALIVAGLGTRRPPLASTGRALELGALLGVSPARIHAALIEGGARPSVPRATVARAAPVKPAAPPAAQVPVTPAKPAAPPEPPRDPAEGPRFLN